MSPSTISRSMLAFTLLCVLGLVGCGGGGGSGGDPADADLFLKKFLIVDKNLNSVGSDGSTDVYRDSRLLFVFSAPVDFQTVSDRTIRVGQPAGGGLFQVAIGRFENVPGHPNWVVFNPTFSKDNVGSTADNPLGFAADAVFSVELRPVGETNIFLRNLSGDGLVQRFDGGFRTTGEYLPSQEQPEISGHAPANGATGVDSRSDITIFFTEPMKPDSFVLGETFIILDAFSGRQPLGTLRYSSDYRAVTFRPVFGYGKGVDDPDPNQAGVPIDVIVTREVTNLAGRRIPVDLSFSFRTEYDPTQPDFDDITEPFDTNAKEDRTYGQGLVGGTYYGDNFPLAEWNKAGGGTGELVAVFTSGTATINNHNNFVTLEPWAVGNNPCQWQALYFASEVGGSARTITGFDWNKYAASFATTCQNVTIQLGHTGSGTVGTNFAGNYSETPVVCAGPATYSISTGVFVFHPGPAFNANFPYNGTDNLILEINHTQSSGGGYTATGAANRGFAEWLENNTGASTRAVHTTPSPTFGPVRSANFAYDVKFFYLIEQSEAQSEFYDTQLDSPQFLNAVILGSQPVGTERVITYQGAPEVPFSGGQPDTTRASDWEPNLSDLSGYRFVKFHVDFKGNGQTKQLPSISELIFPYIYFD